MASPRPTRSASSPKAGACRPRRSAAALLGALLLTWTEKKWPEVQEALIGVLFVVAACVELLILANNPHGGEHLKDLLVGQILWVSLASLWPVAILYAVALAVWFGFRARLGQIGFYVLFALVVTQSVQLVGIYLVFASLIVPALAARLFPSARGWPSAMSSASSAMSRGWSPRRCSICRPARSSWLRSLPPLPWRLFCSQKSRVDGRGFGLI